MSVSFAPCALGITSYNVQRSVVGTREEQNEGLPRAGPVPRTQKAQRMPHLRRKVEGGRGPDNGCCNRDVESKRRNTAWPLLRGWMSRKASTRSDSNSLKAGMSPAKGTCKLLEASLERSRGDTPLTILQKMQATEDMLLT